MRDPCYKNRLKVCIAFPAFLAMISLLDAGFLPESVLGQQGFKWGRAEVQPGVSLEAKYDDNVFLSANEVFLDGSVEVSQEDLIITISPYLIVEQKRQSGDNFGFHFKYLGEDEHFVDLTDQDTFKHDVSGGIELGDVGGDTTWTLGGQFLDTRYPISTEFATNLNPRQDRTTYEFKSKFAWLLASHIEADIQAKFSRNLFDGSKYQEFDQYNGSGTLLWHSTVLTSIGFNYSYRFIDFIEASTIKFDSATQSGSFIFKWKPLSVFSSELWVGFNHIEFEQAAGQDRDDLISQVKLNYKPTSTRSWELVALREIPKSYFHDIQVYQKTGVRLTWNQKLGVKWKGQAAMGFQINRYDIPAVDSAGGGALKLRKDERFSGLLSITYSIQDWMGVLVEYNYIHNDSNFDNVDYVNNTILFRLLFQI